VAGAGGAAVPEGATAVVVGGGIAGLAAAWELSGAAAGLRVVVLEAEPEVGGKIRSAEVGGRTVDLAADAFVARRPEAVELCREIGLADELVAPGATGASVWSRGRLRRLPDGLALGVPTRIWPLARSGIVSPLGLARCALDLLGPLGAPGGRAPSAGEAPADWAVADVTTRRLGREVTERLVDPLIGGIHAGDTRRMSAAAVFPPLLEAGAGRASLMRGLRRLAPATGSEGTPVFLAPRRGMASLVTGLTEALRQRGVEVRTGVAVRGMRRAARWALRTDGGDVDADAVVIATPAPVTACLLEPLDAGAAGVLAAMETADVTVVTVRFAEEARSQPLEGTGFLVPRTEGTVVTACTWLTSKWPHLRRPGDVLVRASAGRAGDERAARLSDDEVAAAVHDELASMVGLGGARETVVTRWPGAFPQYAPGHPTRIAAVEAAVAKLPGLALAGAAFHGVGIPACIGSGRQAGRTALASLATSTTARPGTSPAANGSPAPDRAPFGGS